MILSQHDRPMVVDTPLGADRFLLTALSGEETISRLFHYRLDLLSQDHEIKPEAIVGQPISARLRLAEGGYRRLSGQVGRFWRGAATAQGLRHYAVEMVPWPWFLTHATDCRVFQNLGVVDIATTLFAEFGFTRFDTSMVKEAHPPRDYSVQFNESAFDHIARLLEEEGIFFFFRHDEDGEVLVLADGNQAFQPGTEDRIPIIPDSDPIDGETGRITAWTHRYEFHAGRWAASDYNQESPTAVLHMAQPALPQVSGMDRYERFEWPGVYAKRDGGETVVLRRVQALEAGFHLVEGASGCASFTPGQRFTTLSAEGEADAKPSREGALVVLSVRHDARDDSLLSGEGQSYRYINHFTALPLTSADGQDVTFRPARGTRKPRIDSVQTAVVVGPAGEPIHCDAQARVKVQFHWDRHGLDDDRSSCWVRVSQAWAGHNWGSVQVPHVGQEVLVSFLDGDPDRPIITGRVYNADQANPLVAAAAANRTQSITRDHGGNQIQMEGKAGGQAIIMHSPAGDNHVEVGTLQSHARFAKAKAILEAAGISVPTASGGSASSLQASAGQDPQSTQASMSDSDPSFSPWALSGVATYATHQIYQSSNGSFTVNEGSSGTVNIGDSMAVNYGETLAAYLGPTQFFYLGLNPANLLVPAYFDMYFGSKMSVVIAGKGGLGFYGIREITVGDKFEAGSGSKITFWGTKKVEAVPQHDHVVAEHNAVHEEHNEVVGNHNVVVEEDNHVVAEQNHVVEEENHVVADNVQIMEGQQQVIAEQDVVVENRVSAVDMEVNSMALAMYDLMMLNQAAELIVQN